MYICLFFFNMGALNSMTPSLHRINITLYSDRQLINRRNVTTDVSKLKVDGCKKLFMLALEARIIAAFLQILEISNFDGHPSENNLSADMKSKSQYEKRMFLSALSNEIVSKFILRSENFNLLRQ